MTLAVRSCPGGLGNHDFYQGSISQVRKLVTEVAQESKNLKCLAAMGVEALTPSTAIIGHDGWADGRLGDYGRCDVILNDHLLIAELAVCWNGVDLDKQRLRPIVRALADEAARDFETALETAATEYPNVIAVTHVPPFREAAWYQGKPSNDDFLPYFASKIVGEVTVKVMKAHPQSNLLVLCGHTHGSGEIKVLDNLRVLTGEAQYGRLRVHFRSCALTRPERVGRSRQRGGVCADATSFCSSDRLGSIAPHAVAASLRRRVPARTSRCL